MFSSQNSQVSGAAADPYFNQTTLLLHGDGTNGAQNNTFLDSSTNNFTITRNGNTTQGTFTPFSQAAGYWANYFDGTGDYLTLNGGTPLTFGAGDFTIEFWVYFSVIPGSGGLTILVDFRPASTQGLYPTIYIDGTSKALRYFTNSADRISGSTALSVSTWYHVAVVRSGTNTKMFLNGTQEGSTYTDSNSYICGASRPSIATSGYSINLYVLDGYISNLRALKGTAQYTATFTPPIAPLTAITNTSLLTCQSSRFVDNSTNNFTLTANGNVAVQPFSPFAPTSAYSTAINGGSGYFDGAGDYLTFPQQTYSSDFTIELWVYQTDASGAYIPIVCSESGAYNFPLILDYNGTGYIGGYFQGGTPFGDTGVKVFEKNTWTHIAVSRSGSSIKYFVNGVLVLTLTGTPTLLVDKIGGYQASSYLLKGYISNLRITNTAVYTAAFTPPTAPLTAISGTSLLTNFTNAGIFDNAMKNDLETIGNAQISTSVVKYGTGSMYFDGTGDYLTAPQSTLYDFGTGDFTVEFWTYMNATADTTFISKFISGAYAWLVQYISGTGLRFYWGNNGTLDSFVVGSWSPSTSTWYHVAVTRASGTLRLFIDGTQVGTTTNSSSYTSVTNLSIGRNADAGGIQYLNGYIDDIRITKGVARYTAAFTPPTAAFSNQ